MNLSWLWSFLKANGSLNLRCSLLQQFKTILPLFLSFAFSYLPWKGCSQYRTKTPGVVCSAGSHRIPLLVIFYSLTNLQLVNKKGKWPGIRVQTNTVMLWNRLHWTLGCGKIKDIKINVFVVGWLRQKRCLSIALFKCSVAFFSFTILSLLGTHKHHLSYVPALRQECWPLCRRNRKRRNHI